MIELWPGRLAEIRVTIPPRQVIHLYTIQVSEDNATLVSATPMFDEWRLSVSSQIRCGLQSAYDGWGDTNVGCGMQLKQSPFGILDGGGYCPWVKEHPS